MQDHSHKLLFLGLTGLMSAAAFYGSEAGPTLLFGDDARPPVISAALTPGDAGISFDQDPSKTADLAADGTCVEGANGLSPLCRATSKIALPSP
jgi:hypothetical protein